jgi:transcriptional regulator with XRE-family HTH domain
MDSEIAKYLRASRRKLGLTQTGLSRVLKKQRSTIAKYESANANIRIMPPADVLATVLILMGDFEFPTHSEKEGKNDTGPEITR